MDWWCYLKKLTFSLNACYELLQKHNLYFGLWYILLVIAKNKSTFHFSVSNFKVFSAILFFRFYTCCFFGMQTKIFDIKDPVKTIRKAQIIKKSFKPKND